MRRTNRQHLESCVPADEARAWPRPERKRIFILFTPRSGSSWFGDLLRSTKVMGQPDEFLNQETNAEVVRQVGARTEPDYINAIETIASSGNGVFSIEAVWGHVELSDIDLLGYFEGAHFVYLRRRDILAQAVSLALATSTGVFHDPDGAVESRSGAPPTKIASPETTFAAVQRWWGHLINYECLAEVQIILRGIRPLRLYYEDLVADPPAIVRQTREFCGIQPESGMPPSSTFKPVRSAANAELADLFIRNNREFADQMTSFRPLLR